MRGEWRKSTVDEIAAPTRNALVGGPFGSNLVSRDYVDAGVPVVRGQNMGGRWVSGEFAFVSDTKANSLSANLARPGDIVFTQRGTLGQVSIVPDGQFDRYLVSQSQMKLTVNREFADPMFIYYVFSTAEQQDYIRQNSIQSGVPHTNLGILRGTSLPVPPLGEQRAIAHILGTLDDKIELCRKMNATLEAMAQALFKSWAKDPDPVQADVADLVRDGILEIGDGYRAKNSELGDNGVPFIRAGNLNNGFDTSGADLLRADSVARVGGKVCRVGDVAFTSKGTIGRFARVSRHTPRFVYSPQVCYWRSLDASRLHPVVLYCWMKSDEFSEQLAAVAGQTDMAPYVSLRDQRQMNIPVFPSSQHELVRNVEPLLARLSSNDRETGILAALRDSLLPKLVSGEIEVPMPPQSRGIWHAPTNGV